MRVKGADDALYVWKGNVSLSNLNPKTMKKLTTIAAIVLMTFSTSFAGETSNNETNKTTKTKLTKDQQHRKAGRILRGLGIVGGGIGAVAGSGGLVAVGGAFLFISQELRHNAAKNEIQELQIESGLQDENSVFPKAPEHSEFLSVQ